VLIALENYVELEKKKRLYLSKMKEEKKMGEESDF